MKPRHLAVPKEAQISEFASYDTSIRFQVLGTVQMLRNGDPVAMGGTRQKRILAALLMEANQIVPISKLMDATWRNPPSTARTQIQIEISKLRRSLKIPDPRNVICTQSQGYILRAMREQIDGNVFREHTLAAKGNAALGKFDQAITELRQGLSLWQGPAIAGIDSPLLGTWARFLEEERVAAIEMCMRLELRRGGHREIVSELIHAAESHPLRESLQCLLMQALYLSQRQAEALDVYRRTRARLIEQLGVEPGEEMNQVHYEILSRKTERWLSPQDFSTPAAPLSRATSA